MEYSSKLFNVANVERNRRTLEEKELSIKRLKFKSVGSVFYWMFLDGPFKIYDFINSLYS